MRAVPIPGEILRTDVFLGLTFNELITLGAAPLVMVFPSLFIKQIPFIVTIGLAVLFSIGVLGVVLQTPDGQTPVEWAPAAAKRRLTPETYYLKPRHRKRDELRHLDVVKTADQIHAESASDTVQSDSSADTASGVGSLSEETLPGEVADISAAPTADTSETESEPAAASDETSDDRSAVIPLTD